MYDGRELMTNKCKILAGVRVVDLTSHLAGPYAGMLLADLGADVIKIEDARAGDGSRRWGRPREDGRSFMFLTVNRGKRDVAVDIRRHEGRSLVHRLLARADVMTESFAPGRREELGLGPEQVAEVAPHIIYGSISGAGRSGPLSEVSGYDLMYQAYCGLLSMNGEPQSPPCKIPVPLLDVFTGASLAMGIVAVLRGRAAGTIEPAFTTLDYSLYDSAVNLLSYNVTEASVTGVSPARMGAQYSSLYPYGVFEASDDYFYLGVANDHSWRSLCRIMGLVHLEQDPRFATNAARLASRDVLQRILEPAFAKRTAAEWVETARSLSIPAGRIRGVSDLLGDEHLRVRESMVVASTETEEHGGAIRAPSFPGLIDGQRPEASRQAPRLGADTRAVVAELGYTDEQLGDLIRTGAIFQRSE